MIIFVLVVFGLCLGSFVNALIWRLREQELMAEAKEARSKTVKAKSTKTAGVTGKDLSIMHGRSMCPNCHHQLAAKDLVPVLSWLSVRGKCRYCKKSISAQYPIVELFTAGLFVSSYLFWPVAIEGAQIGVFALWLLLLVGFMALIVYDLKWFLLPNRIVYPLSAIAGLMAIVEAASAANPGSATMSTILAVAVGGGIFYVLFQVSGGKWIGGGDVKLGWLLGLAVGTPAQSLLFIFLAALGGSVVSLPLLLSGRIKRSAVIPFGPFLIVAAIVVKLFGADILDWYQHALLLGSY